jgi:uncharacterized protein (TIGR03118 family)
MSGLSTIYRSTHAWIIPAAAALCLVLNPYRTFAASNGYIQHNIVSDVPLVADLTDPNLVNPWGITPPNFWVCDQGTGLSTVYTNSTATGTEAVSTVVVTVAPPASRTTPGGSCTGIVDNTTAGAFAPVAGATANFIFATQDGTISARNGSTSVLKVDNSAAGAVYDGLAIFNSPTANFLYAANFSAGTIDVFDTNYAKVTPSGTFTDPSVPAGFAPFNIQNLGGRLFVTYAKQNAGKRADVAGVGNGYVAVFDTNGNLLQHLISGGPLNSPWGIQLAPPTFGQFGGDLLVGNFEDGLINAFNPSTGAYVGTLQDPSGNNIAIPGLWGLQVGAGGGAGFPNTLYFCAGISVEGSPLQTHGLFGSISTAAAPVVTAAGVVNAATYTAGTGLAPGSIAVIFGSNLTEGISACIPPACLPAFRIDNRLNTTLAGAQVEINGVAAPMFYASPTQMAIQIPVESTPGSTATLQPLVNGEPGAAIQIPIVAVSPGLFFSGTNVGVITHANGTVVTTASPAVPGETVTIYATGLGAASPVVPTGVRAGANVTVASAPTVTIDTLSASPSFAGLANGSVGLNQISVVVPASVHRGTNVNVVLSTGGQQSNTVTLATAP